jgi:hypothetical protein
MRLRAALEWFVGPTFLWILADFFLALMRMVGTNSSSSIKCQHHTVLAIAHRYFKYMEELSCLHSSCQYEHSSAMTEQYYRKQ